MLKTIYHFFRLIRIVNLLVIGLTMLVVEIFLLRYNGAYNDKTDVLYIIEYVSSSANHFLWLVVSTLLIAAAGNIINDYFDVKADRINKPNRLIIGKYIKRRWAMLLHWSFNSLGLIIALYVGYVLQNIWVPLVAFLSINLLWFYSAYYKRKPFIGNLIVALLLGVIPVYVMLFNFPLKEFDDGELEYFYAIIFSVSSLAFLLNLIRELVKDIQDIRGDLRLGAKTFPIKYGIKKTKILIGLIAVVTIVNLIFYFYFTMVSSIVFMFFYDRNINLDLIMLLIYGAGFFFLISLILIIFFNRRKAYKIASILLKLAMLFGLLTPLFL
jgi:4-hydroxybenzoate polyprenyltransferase